MLRVVSITRQQNGNVQLTWSSVPGMNYDVWANTNVTQWVSPISGTIPSGGSLTSYTDTSVPSGPRFYKVRVVP